MPRGIPFVFLPGTSVAGVAGMAGMAGHHAVKARLVAASPAFPADSWALSQRRVSISRVAKKTWTPAKNNQHSTSYLVTSFKNLSLLSLLSFDVSLGSR